MNKAEIVNESPLYVSPEYAATRSGLGVRLIENLTQFDPYVEERAPVGSRVSRNGALRVDLLDVLDIAGAAQECKPGPADGPFF